MAVLLSLFVVLFWGTQTVYALNILDSDLNSNGIIDSTETEVVVTSNKSLQSGEYNFGNLTITNNAVLTLVGDPLSPDQFKGVKINATNISVSFGSRISADGQGYISGPGTSLVPGISVGASYGGSGGGNSATSTYGSAMTPMDLGSGTSGSKGGGSIRLVVSNTLLNNGDISANGQSYRTSGGSIHVTTNILVGTGVFNANGARTYWPNQFAGGGGRIAVHYQQSSFTGSAKANAGVFCLYGCNPAGGAGTVVFFDTVNNDLYTGTSWRFQKNDEPIRLNRIVVSNGSSVTMDEGVAITANELIISGATSLPLSKGSLLTIHKITVDGATIVSSGEETIVADILKLINSAVVTVVPMQTLTLSVPNVTIDTSSRISADAKGDTAGSGFPSSIYAGGSHGGVGLNNTATSTYGSAKQPTTLGSAGGAPHAIGGGAIRLVVSGSLVNNGVISADGNTSSSGGSIYATVADMSGSGTFHANGGALGSGGYFSGPGGGGRVAVYYQTSSFSGAIEALGGCGSYDGWSRVCAGYGTVVIQQSDVPCTINCYSNIMFLPGVMGSRLYDENGQELWVSSDDSLQSTLAMNASGKSINSIYTNDDTHRNHGEIDESGLVDDVYGSNIYESFVNDLRVWKGDNDNGIIHDYAFIPYDWRLSLEDIVNNGATSTPDKLSYADSPASGQYILKQLEALQKSSRTGKVTIVAHSNGGLVTKALIEKLKLDNNPLYNQIDKVIFVAVPQVGTPDAVATLLHGNSLGHGAVMTTARSRELAKNIPTIYNLLPSAQYFNTVEPGFAVDKVVSFENKPSFSSQLSQYGVYVSNENELKGYVLNDDSRSAPVYADTNSPAVGNRTLYDDAQRVHTVLDNWQPASTTKVIQVAGWGAETLAGIDNVEAVSVPALGIFTHTINLRHVVDGDGTVVVPSALWMATSTPGVERWWVNLIRNNAGPTIDRDHRDILEVDNLRNFIKSEIKGSLFSDSSNIVVNATSTLISEGERLHFTLHSPLTLGITDTQGRYTGLDPVTGEIKEEIPSTTYKQYGEVQFLSVPVGLQYTLKLKGYETGTFALDVEKQIGNTVTESTSFQAIPTATSTAVMMDISSVFEVASSTLVIDQNADGVIDASLEAAPSGVTIYDLTAPVTTATPTGTLGLNQYYTSSVTITLISEDTAPLGEVSSGVVITKYSLDSGTTWNTYSTSTPLTIVTEGTTALQYYSVDNNGNTETPKTLTLNIDTVAPTIFASDTSAEQLTIEGTTLTVPATTEDTIDPSPTLTTNVPLTQTFVLGVTSILLTAQDLAGNIATSSIAVTIYSSPTADPDGDGVPNQDDVKPFDATVFANLTIPAEYAFWEKESFDLPFSVAGKGNVTLSLSNTYYKVETSPIKDSVVAIVPATVLTVDGVVTVSFSQDTKELKTYTLTLTTTKGNTKERKSLKEKRDHESDEGRRHDLEKELDFADAPITLSITNTTANKTTSQISVINIYDKQQTAQLQYKYKDTDYSTTLLLKSDDVLKTKKGQPLELTVKVTGIKKDVPFTTNISGNFTILSVVQEEEHKDDDDRKQTKFSLFYPLSTQSTQENITITTTVNGITSTDVVGVKFEE
ncbi:MAG: hypothetical protein UU88_C0003G0046 [Parcubacteria group bacterium GW2011_GWC1_42_11]|uniref:HYR domain-containing protein n=1 Tax=Candidatus Nomurabacteria bacterium GW2011_GWC2_42_20 TaxID=1618756 RepID=A0A0G1BQ64_9BACT|nr:MAG: hypothetical protein UU88_C0003G0046 [Parcubacteria group bacterium GW2011_GWC1_42_11]KKS48381.1 MAG: hypothetical protein UV12_C0001G0076 [Candidatus Nomurabacteria bacterium GW2011_GWC2_42_20]KKS59460.1 MAG: hypothetical protein UV24_C0001G0048 [Candidatus Nomurabacteria bacterium GW2011_GWA2_42_41]KKT09957.1 MAG: hypothetical protein UV86_C0001G0059 [Candidatus Nomurabacteria bacterium GW2011_GWB1_43_20]